MGRPDLASRALKTVRWTVFTRRDVGRRARAVQIRPMFSRRRLLQIKRCNPLRGCILVGPAGFEPTQWRSQSPLPYRLATAQQKKRPRSIITVRSLVGCLERFELSASRATIWRANQLRYTHHITNSVSLFNVPEGIRTPDPRLRRPLLYPTELQAQSRKIRSLILSFQTASEGNTLADRYKLYHQQGRLSSTFLRLTEIFRCFR